MADTCPFYFPFLNLENKEIKLELKGGKIFYVVGANGTGKSALLAHLTRQNLHRSKRILAHRQTWISADEPIHNPTQREQIEQQLLRFDSKPESRWRDNLSRQRPHLIINGLINKINKEARSFEETILANPDSPITRKIHDTSLGLLNSLLGNAHLNFTISIGDNESLVAKDKKGNVFDIAALSDGERNVLLLIIDVLTAPSNMLILIDEPERHLHRSIVSPLLTSLFKTRNDCPFVIATHDISLPLDNPKSTVVILRGCVWYSPELCGWDADIMEAADGIPYDIKKDILGARKKILFIEGMQQSLDNSLYQILFPDVTVIPKGNCRAVCQAVDGVTTTESQNWANAFGLIDRDSRDDQEIEELQKKKIFALRCYSVETIYYSVSMIRQMAARKAKFEGGDPDALVKDALDGLLQSVSEKKETLCARLCDRKIRAQVKFPTVKEIIARKKITAHEFDTGKEMDAEIAILDKFISERDFDAIVTRYPIRLSPALERIATALRYTDETHYEDAVRFFLQQDESARLECRKALEPLTSAIDAV